MPAAERMPDDLREELAAPDRRKRLVVDPRTVPVRFSTLKEMARSPLHYWHAVQGGFRDETLSMRLGTGTHALVFGTPEVVVYRGGEMADAKGKVKKYTAVRSGACWEAFQAEHEGKVILSDSEYEKARAMADALLGDLDADPLLFAPGTKHEHDLQWEVEIVVGGVLHRRKCKGRLDALGPVAVTDLKGVKSADPRYFPIQAAKADWHAQAVWYADGAKAAGLGERVPYLVAVENSAPHMVTVWPLSASAIDHGRRRYMSWLERLIEHEQCNEWPGYAPGPIEFHVPKFLVDDPAPVNDGDDEAADDLIDSVD